MEHIRSQRWSQFKFTNVGRVVEFMRLLYVMTTKKTRAGSANALYAIIKRIIIKLIFIASFWMLMEVTGLRDYAGRGSFLLFLLIGISFFMIHISAFQGGLGGSNPNDPITMHAPITPLLELFSSGFSQLYTNIVSLTVVGLFIHFWVEPVVIDDLPRFFLCLFWTIASGMAFGCFFAGFSAFIPEIGGMAQRAMRRANMIFSGKMFAANTLPPSMIPFFYWNPLFHTIDQARDAAFINYSSNVTTLSYTIWFTFVFFALGLMMMHAAKKLVSPSWAARR